MSTAKCRRPSHGKSRLRPAALRGDVTDARDLARVVSQGVQTGPVAERARELSQEMDVLGQRMDDLQRVDPEIIVEPFLTETESIAEVSPSLADFFAPAVLALLLQHLAVTFAGLSIVRDHHQGTMELFRVSPLSAIETLLGKYLAYLAVGGLVAAALAAAATYGLGVPMLAGPRQYALVVGGLLFASLGVGFVISLISQNENQAVQYSMLVLLTGVFFSGFLVILTAITKPIRYISWAMPVTYGIQLLRNVTFRGQIIQWEFVAVLYGLGAVLMFVAWLLLRRQMAAR